MLDRTAFFGILLVVMLTFILGYDGGRRYEHTLLHSKYVKLCPTHAVSHTTAGDHICYLDAISVRKLDE